MKFCEPKNALCPVRKSTTCKKVNYTLRKQKRGAKKVFFRTSSFAHWQARQLLTVPIVYYIPAGCNKSEVLLSFSTIGGIRVFYNTSQATNLVHCLTLSRGKKGDFYSNWKVSYDLPFLVYTIQNSNTSPKRVRRHNLAKDSDKWQKCIH